MSISRHHPLLDFNTFATLGMEVCGAVARNLWQMHRYEEVKYSQRERPHLTRGSHARLRELCWYPQIGKLYWYPQTGKLCWYPHSNKLLQKCVIFNKAIKTHSRGPTEQHFYVWEPHCGCLHKVKKCAGAPSLERVNRAINAFWRANRAIKLKSVLVPRVLYYLDIIYIMLKGIV